MDTKYIYFAAFKGISLLSKTIRWWTRSEYSHIGFVIDSDHLFEAWKFKDGCYWGHNKFTNHTPNTPVEIWGKKVTKDQAARTYEFIAGLVRNRCKYDFRGLFGFVLKTKDSKDRYFCSEGCAEALKYARVWPKDLKTYVVHPGYFVQLMLVSGFSCIDKFTIGR